jgi:hypothetical protein
MTHRLLLAFAAVVPAAQVAVRGLCGLREPSPRVTAWVRPALRQKRALLRWNLPGLPSLHRDGRRQHQEPVR